MKGFARTPSPNLRIFLPSLVETQDISWKVIHDPSTGTTMAVLTIEVPGADDLIQVVGSSKLHPDDEYDFEIGRALASGRMLEALGAEMQRLGAQLVNKARVREGAYTFPDEFVPGVTE